MPGEPTAKPRIYVSAFFCQEVIRDKSDILTAIRITNAYTTVPTSVTVEIGSGLTVTKQVYMPFVVCAVLTFHSDNPVDFEVRLRGFDPDGIELSTGDQFHCHSQGGAAGHVLNTRLTIATGKQGEYRLDVYVDDLLATTMPPRIIHAKLADDHQSDQPSEPAAAASE